MRIRPVLCVKLSDQKTTKTSGVLLLREFAIVVNIPKIG